MNLKWKRELPTRTGWYWLRRTYKIKGVAEMDVEIVRVRSYGRELAIGNTTLSGWPAIKQMEWAGPIPEPEE